MAAVTGGGAHAPIPTQIGEQVSSVQVGKEGGIVETKKRMLLAKSVKGADLPTLQHAAEKLLAELESGKKTVDTLQTLNEAIDSKGKLDKDKVAKLSNTAKKIIEQWDKTMKPKEMKEHVEALLAKQGATNVLLQDNLNEIGKMSPEAKALAEIKTGMEHFGAEAIRSSTSQMLDKSFLKKANLLPDLERPAFDTKQLVLLDKDGHNLEENFNFEKIPKSYKFNTVFQKEVEALERIKFRLNIIMTQTNIDPVVKNQILDAMDMQIRDYAEKSFEHDPKAAFTISSHIEKFLYQINPQFASDNKKTSEVGTALIAQGKEGELTKCLTLFSMMKQDFANGIGQQVNQCSQLAKVDGYKGIKPQERNIELRFDRESNSMTATYRTMQRDVPKEGLPALDKVEPRLAIRTELQVKVKCDEPNVKLMESHERVEIETRGKDEKQKSENQQLANGLSMVSKAVGFEVSQKTSA